MIEVFGSGLTALKERLEARQLRNKIRWDQIIIASHLLRYGARNGNVLSLDMQIVHGEDGQNSTCLRAQLTSPNPSVRTIDKFLEQPGGSLYVELTQNHGLPIRVHASFVPWKAYLGDFRTGDAVVYQDDQESPMSGIEDLRQVDHTLEQSRRMCTAYAEAIRP